jgi:hypothetical protein
VATRNASAAVISPSNDNSIVAPYRSKLAQP